jgi:transcriptional regulator with XRE-family HTH domain
MQLAEIKSYLKKHKITYSDLSQKSGIPIGTLKNIFAKCSTNPRIDTVQAIERALGLSSSFTDEDYANGVTSSAKIPVSSEEYEWLELRNEVIRVKGEDYYKMLVNMIEAVIKQKT